MFKRKASSGSGSQETGETQKKKKCDQNTGTDPEECDIIILLIGKTGTGKSSAGNIIINSNHFAVGENTLVCEKGFHNLPDGRRLAVIDTPGLFHTILTPQEMKRQLVRCLSLCAPGPHVFLFVIDPTSFSEKEEDMVEIIRKIFGERAPRYAMVLFTHGDQMPVDPNRQRILHLNQALNDFLSECRGGYHIFDNEIGNRTQVIELVEKIDSMVQRNGGSCYTNDMFREAQRAIREEVGGHRGPAERNNSFIRAVDQAAVAEAAAEVGDAVKRGRSVRDNWCVII
ncbi:GTPase IMAP family member 4-like [Poeciliopsis prolifica]|uniref:GTPase IMAP family member 4-like n=1 Tax=Poeciliopsis prolifica TaxID=188132 RepID=UPI0024134F1D|nr:GTPase IMAP family member 4-like [Poeciliopsis prolifica]